MKKKLKAFRMDDDVVKAMRHVKDTERISEAGQIDLAMREWLQRRGSLPKPRPLKKSDPSIVFRGWRWFPPFICFYCARPVSEQQWRFSRSCGGCDMGVSSTRRLDPRGGKIFAGPHELVDPSDSHFIPEDHFLDPATAAQYSTEADRLRRKYHRPTRPQRRKR